MLVRDCMSANPVTITPDTSVPDALRLMRTKRVRRFPVVDAHGRLVGIVSETDLLHASPSPATTLSVWEMTELLSRIKVSEIMTRDVVTVPEDLPLEEAARLMADRKIGGLPVVRGDALAGIITETDIFKTLLELLGGRRPGVRITVSLPGAKGALAKLTSAIFAAGGDIVGLGISEVTAGAKPHWAIMFKVQDATADQLVAALRPISDAILDVRQA